MDWVAIGNALVSWFKNPVKVMFCLSGCAAVAIFTPARWQIWAGVYDWTMTHRVFEFWLLTFCLVFVVVSFFQFLWMQAIIWKSVRNLASDQKLIIKHYVQNNLAANVWVVSDTAARTLEEEKILIL